MWTGTEPVTARAALFAEASTFIVAQALDRTLPLDVGVRFAWTGDAHPGARRDHPTPFLGAPQAVPVSTGQPTCGVALVIATDDEEVGLRGRGVTVDIDDRVRRERWIDAGCMNRLPGSVHVGSVVPCVQYSCPIFSPADSRFAAAVAS
jgi:hypothetical protein